MKKITKSNIIILKFYRTHSEQSVNSGLYDFHENKSDMSNMKNLLERTNGKKLNNCSLFNPVDNFKFEISHAIECNK